MRQEQHEPHALGPAALRLWKIKQQMRDDARKRHLSVRGLAAKYDCSVSTARCLLEDKGATSIRWAAARLASASAGRRRSKVVDQSPAARFFADARTGLLTRHELAAKYRLSYTEACYHILEARIKLPREPSVPSPRVVAARYRRLILIRSLRGQGKTLDEIGRRFGVTGGRIWAILARGWP